jgi:hypothetical protein
MSESNIIVSCILIQSLGEGLIIEMNVDQDAAVRNIKWCDAANRKTHGEAKE